jgi:CRP/FNR family transcriptional regulator
MVNHNDYIHTTHQEIASDLHTSRVVVSRLLKKMEKEGKINLNRNQIQVVQL